jgi:cytochrome P450
MTPSQDAMVDALPPIRDLDNPNFDPFVDDVLAWGDLPDPYPKLQAMARENWIHEVEYRRLFMTTPNAMMAKYDFRYFTVFGYDNCVELLSKSEVFSSEFLKINLAISFGKTISGMDAPEHGRYRKIFQKVFLPNKVRTWGEPVVSPVVEGLLGKVEGNGRCDLIADFTQHFPFQVVYRQLNLPVRDITIFHKLAAAQTSYFYAPEMAYEAGQKLGEYFSRMVQARREDPGEDLVSVLATAEADGERLPEEVVVSFLRQLTNAGGDTTYRGTSVLLTALLQNPDQLAAVRKDRSLIPAAIEEALRWDGPLTTVGRITTRDYTHRGATIPARSVVDFVQGQANRDPAKFSDPDRFDIFRDRPVRHIAFTVGPHVCIGQHLARVEMERALNAVLDRLPNVRLDPDMPPPQIEGYKLRKPRHLYVRFD